MCAQSLSSVWPFVTPWNVALQAPLSMGILQAKIVEWVVMPFSRESSQPRFPALHADSLPSEPPGKPKSLTVSYFWNPNLFCCSAQDSQCFSCSDFCCDHLTCLLRNLYTGQETTVETRYGTMEWFKTGKSMSRLYIVTLLI